MIQPKTKKTNLEKALQVVASIASTEIVDILIEHGAQPESMAMHYALHPSNQDSRLSMMNHLLRRGVGINNFGNAPTVRAGGTPLFTAGTASQLTDVWWLLDHGLTRGSRMDLGESLCGIP